jgi:hypothetical protein
VKKVLVLKCWMFSSEGASGSSVAGKPFIDEKE